MSETTPNYRSRALWSDGKGPAWRRLVQQYGVALLAIAVALAVRLLLVSILRGDASYLFYLPAILIASALSGWGPGLLATGHGACSRPLLRHRSSLAGGFRHHQRHHIRPRWDWRVMARRAIASIPCRRRNQCRGSRVARCSSAIDSRQHSGCHDRYRRARHRAIV